MRSRIGGGDNFVPFRKVAHLEGGAARCARVALWPRSRCSGGAGRLRHCSARRQSAYQQLCRAKRSARADEPVLLRGQSRTRRTGAQTRRRPPTTPPFPIRSRTACAPSCDNLRTPIVLANDLMQGEGERAEVTLSRFMVNTSIGLLGVFDVATEIGLEVSRRGFRPDDGGRRHAPAVPISCCRCSAPTNPRDLVGRVVERSPSTRSPMSSEPMRGSRGRASTWSTTGTATARPLMRCNNSRLTSMRLSAKPIASGVADEIRNRPTGTIRPDREWSFEPMSAPFLAVYAGAGGIGRRALLRLLAAPADRDYLPPRKVLERCKGPRRVHRPSWPGGDPIADCARPHAGAPRAVPRIAP